MYQYQQWIDAQYDHPGYEVSQHTLRRLVAVLEQLCPAVQQRQKNEPHVLARGVGDENRPFKAPDHVTPRRHAGGKESEPDAHSLGVVCSFLGGAFDPFLCELRWKNVGFLLSDRGEGIFFDARENGSGR